MAACEGDGLFPSLEVPEGADIPTKGEKELTADHLFYKTIKPATQHTGSKDNTRWYIQ